MNKSFFADKIAEWYNTNQRSLPWRDTNDPYNIWLSEIILQQTRVAQGLPYYLKFIESFPNVVALAKAREREVLRLWQGLGYYTRARNLHSCAKIVVRDHGGKFPNTRNELQKLPGIGPYTAAAIASIAFKEPVAALDGNVYRVLSRIFGIEKDISTGEGRDYFAQQANALIDKTDPGTFNQAMMEFGATVCLPRLPRCETCIFKKQCIAFTNNWQDRLPVKTKKLKIRKRYFYYFIIEQDKKWLMQKRGEKDIWQGLYDFYLVETNRPQRPEKMVGADELLKGLDGQIQTKNISRIFKHILTHQHLLARFIPFTIRPSGVGEALIKSRRLKFYTSQQMEKLPKPVLVSRYLLEGPFYR